MAPTSSAEAWRTASRSVDNTKCVEVAFLGPGTVGVRDSKQRAAARLTVSPTAWRTFLAAINHDEFQH